MWLICWLLLAQLGGQERSFYIPSGSMSPTLKPGDYVMVLPSPRYGLNDIIVCERPQRLKVDSRIIISRIVGLAGDVVEIRQHHL